MNAAHYCDKVKATAAVFRSSIIHSYNASNAIYYLALTNSFATTTSEENPPDFQLHDVAGILTDERLHAQVNSG